MPYIMYLRKSRADIEAEAMGEMETLARHEATLKNYADQHNLDITKTYKEIVSGDSISERPMMQKLLSDVKTGLYDGVLVMEIERLARGDGIDQGIVSQTFKASHTLIVTPSKTYDPSNDFDETFMEFGLFMSRQEYKTIKRRLLAGRLASTREGNYAGSNNPYGYKRVHTHKNTTLEIVPAEAEIIKRMYEMYVNENKGFMVISRELREAGLADIKPAKVKDLIHSPLYKGYVTFGRNKTMTVVDEDGRRHKEWHIQKDYLCCKGKHEAIVDEELWQKAQDIADKRWHSSKSKDCAMRNRLQGILYCADCGHVMRLKLCIQGDRRYYYYLCNKCHNKQIQEAQLLEIINGMISEHYSQLKGGVSDQQSNLAELTAQGERIAKAKSELNQLIAQKDKICDSYERGIYDDDTFERRMKSVKEKEEKLNAIINAPRLKYRSQASMLVNFEAFTNSIDHIENHEQANDLYKLIVDRIDYHKESKKAPEITISYAM